jgi:predicted DsbA family dithiol-disulfide isomerase
LPIAQGYGVSASDVEASWQKRRFRSAVDVFIDQANRAGVTGVPAMAWPNQRAIVGMMRPEELVVRLRNQALAS